MKKIELTFAWVLVLLFTSCLDTRNVTRGSYILGFYGIENIDAAGTFVQVSDVRYARINVYVQKARMVTDIFGDRILSISKAGHNEKLYRG